MADIQQKLQEEKQLKAIRAKRRFRAAIRAVIYNMYWIQEDDEWDSIDPSNVKQAVTRMTRHKKKSRTEGLSIKEKSILRKDAQYRTNEEKKLLNKFIGGLKCFRLYPENVQMELVEVTYFDYYGPGRILIKQNHEGHALYFLLSGEVIISKIMLDEVANVYQDVEINRTPAGNMFGEISLLHNIPRTATVTTSAPCELLVLKKVDFDRVLKKSLLQRWDDIRVAMLKFRYFDGWDSVAIRECCMLAKMKTFQPNQIIYGDKKSKKGAPKNTYFVVEGSCSVIEHLFIEETVKRGNTYYKLHTPVETVNGAGGKELKTCSLAYDSVPADLETSHVDDEYDNRTIASDESLGSCILRSKTDTGFTTPQECIQSIVRKSMKSDALLAGFEDRDSSHATLEEQKSTTGHKISKVMSILEYKNYLHQLRKSKEGIKYYLAPNVKLRFMQICVFRELGTFLGDELMENRRLIAMEPLKLLIIPTYWLAQHNKGNIWTRVEQYLNAKMPTREQVFAAYVKNKKWQEYKKKVRNEILSKRNFFNNTTIHDVPYSIRIMSNYEL